MIKGIDISYHNHDVDFCKVKSGGYEFVIIRSSYRNTTDPKFFEYVKKAKAAGLVILGVYHFSYALNKKEVIEEAHYCVDKVKNAGLNKDILIFYDFEYDTVRKAANSSVFLRRNECNMHTIAFCEEIKKLGYTPGVYTNLDYYKNWYTKDVLKKYKVWLADYKGGPDYDCLIQQYSSEGKVPGIIGNVDLDYYYGDNFKMGGKIMKTRNDVVKLAKSWIGKNEKDGSHKEIIDIYNSYTGKLPRGVKMTYTASWCATFWSAIAIKLGCTDIMPIECSCGELIKKAKEMGVWQESDAYTALPGDAILYDWDDNGIGDNTGWPDHIGVIEKISNSIYTVIEGNKNDAVGRRTIKVNSKFIRGFITPKYDDELVTDTNTNKTYWTVMTHSLNCREKATTTSKVICAFPQGTVLVGTGNIQNVNGKKWIEVIVPSKNRTGWCSSQSNGTVYLKEGKITLS